MLAPRPLLLVDDDGLDAMILERSLRELKITNELTHKYDGEAALAYLQSCSPLPCAILLDVNMPRMNGFEFLRHVKADETLKNIPVLMLTTSTARDDMILSFELGAVEYIVKTPSIAEFLQSLEIVAGYFRDNIACEEVGAASSSKASASDSDS